MDTVLRTLGLLLVTVLCFRLMGYRSFGDMEPIDFVIVLGIAEILGAPLADEKLKISSALIAIATLTGLQIFLSYLTLKSKSFLKFLEGQPIPVIKEGRILRNNLRKARFNQEDLMEELRIHGLTSVHDVELANLEPSGRFSVVRKKEAEPITPRYLGRNTSLTLMENGQIFPDKMQQAGFTPAHLSEILSGSGIEDFNEVESLVISPLGHLVIMKKPTKI